MSLFPVFAPGTAVTPVVTAFTHNATLEPNATNFTFNSVDIGTASDDRKIIVAAMASGGSGAGGPIGCTLGGNAMTPQVSVVDGGQGSALFELDVSSGTSATVVVQCADSKGFASIAVFAVTGAPLQSNFTRTFTNIASTTGDTTPNTTISTPALGNIIGTALFTHSSGGAYTAAWTNVTERFDAMADTQGSTTTACSDDFATAQSDLAVAATSSTGAVSNATMALVAYGPAATAGSPPITCSFTASAGDATAGAAVRTYSSVDIGTASSGRYVIVAAGTTGGGGGTDDINSITVGGTGLTNTGVTALHTDHTLIEFWAGVIDSGTSADIVVTYARSANRAGIAVWQATGIGSILDSGSANVTNSTNLMSDTINVAAGGLVLGYAFHADGNTITTSWEPTLTENFEANINVGGDHSAATATFASAHTALPFGAKADSAPDYGLTVFASWNPA